MNKEQLRDNIRNYIYKSILDEEHKIKYNTHLYSNSLISSMDHLKLINYLENEFNISIPMNDLSIDEFDTVNQITDFIDLILNNN